MKYETEEQQIEALKGWWQANYLQVIGGLVIGLGLILGWRYYTAHQHDHAAQASDSYSDYLSMFATPGQDSQAKGEVADKLLDEYGNTPYAALAAMAQAAKDAEAGNMQAAESRLQWVVGNARQSELKHIASLRLGRLYLAQNRLDEALKIVNGQYPESFTTNFQELKGDILVAKGESGAARTAYDKAIMHAGETASPWLMLKREDLGNTEFPEPEA